MDLIVNGIIGATIANFMKNITNFGNHIAFSLTISLASVVAGS